nr:immunoglobulin light chain junction region [Macaca mulatta]
CQQDYDSPFSF